MARARRPAGARRSGRAGVVALAAVAALICGGFFYWLLRPGAPAIDPRLPALAAPQAPLERPGRTDEMEEAGTAPAGAALALDEAAAPLEAPGGDPASPESGIIRLRLHGTVESAGGEPLPDARIRWLPLREEELAAHLHDGAVLGSETDPAALAGELRIAFSRGASATSGEGGEYELELDLPAGSKSGVVAASAAGYRPQVNALSPELTASAEGDGAASLVLELDFLLEPASGISGRVTARANGEPAVGMQVTASPVEQGVPELAAAMRSIVGRAASLKEKAASASVGEDGRYEIIGLGPGEYRVLPQSGRSRYAPLPYHLGKRIVLEAGGHAAGVDFQVDAGGVIRGQVFGAGGEPVGGARVSVLPTDLAQGIAGGDLSFALLLDRQAQSGADGSFEIAALPLGRTYRVLARKEGWAPAASEELDLASEEPELEVELEMTRGSTLSGRVVFPDGRPAAGFEVRSVADFASMMALGGGSPGGSTTSDATGSFRLEHLPAGEYRLVAGSARPEMFFPGWANAVIVEVDGSSDVTGVVLTTVEESGAEVSGRVVDDIGRPLAGAEVRISTALHAGPPLRASTSGPDGRFTISKLDGGPFSAEASLEGYSSMRLAVEAGNRSLELVLQRHGRISGRVVTAARQPLAASGGKVAARLHAEEGGFQAEIQRLVRMQARGGAGEHEAPLDEEGRFDLRAPAGLVEVHAYVPGFAPARSEPVRVAPGEKAGGIEIRVTAGAVLRGRVTFAGEGIEGADVSALAPGESPLAEMMPQMFREAGRGVTTDEQGRFELRHLPPGDYAVKATHALHAPSAAVHVTLAEDQVRQLRDLALAMGGVITGTISEAGEPKAGMMVQLIGGELKQTFSDAGGRFRFQGAGAGEYLLQFMDLGALQKGKMLTKSRYLELAEGQALELEVVFGLGRRISGTVKGLPPAPLRMVQLRRPGGPPPEALSPTDTKRTIAAGRYQAGIAMIDAEGNFELTDIEPGEYILEIPRMPADPSDISAYEKMDRTPHHREEVRIGDRDLELRIEIE
jgi:hypothetical protein